MNLKHGMCHTRIYKIYKHMRDRCYNKNYFQYYLYGGRGIIICDEWLNDFVTFYEWAIDNGYNDDLTIDRINTNGNYEPSNCSWVTIAEQNRNQRKNINITYQGETHCLSEWARIKNIPIPRLYWRYKHWKNTDEIFNKDGKRN